MVTKNIRYENAINKRLKNRKNRDLVLYGTDIFSQCVYDNLTEMGINVLYFVEDNSELKELKGKEIRNPFELFKENKDSIFILVSKMVNHGGAYKKLVDMQFEFEFDFSIMGIHGYMDPCDSIDTLLGYNREDDLLGFKIFGSKDNKSSYKIVTLGGSTTDPSLGGCKSWSELLYYDLKKRGYNITIYCGGMAGYASTQEFLKLNRDVLNLKPDMVLTLSGVNDAVFLGEQEEKKPFVTGYQKKFFDYLSKNEIGAPDTLDMRNVKKITYGLGTIEQDYEVWINNMRKMNCICNEFGIIFKCFLQPMIYSGGYILEEELKNILEEYTKLNKENVLGKKVNKSNIQIFYQNIKKHIEKYPYIIDLTNIFSEMSEIYIDWCHYNNKGHEIIAKKILYEVEKHINEGRRVEK